MFGRSKQWLFAMSIIVAAVFVGIAPARAALKDSDVDGITDEAEMQTYRTDPKNHDTDGDGFDDGYEVVQQTNPIDPNDIPFGSVSDAIDHSAREGFWWRMFLFSAGVSAVSGLVYVVASRRKQGVA